MQAVDADVEGVVVLVYQTNDFLLLASGLDFFEAREASHAVVDVCDVVAGLEFEELFEGQGLAVLAEVADGVFMVAFEDFVVGVAEQMLVVVDEALAQRIVEVGDSVGEHTAFGKDFVEALALLFAAGADAEGVAALVVVRQRLLEELELLVERGLRVTVGVDDGGFGEERRVAGLDDLAVEQGLEEFIGGGIELVGLGVVQAYDVLLLVGSNLFVFRYRGGVAFLDGFADVHQAVGPDDVLAAEILQQVDFFFYLEAAALPAFEVGDDADLVEMAYGELCDGIEAAQRIDAVVKELDAERFFVGVGEDVDDAATHSELTRIDDEVDALECVFLQRFDDEVHIELAALEDLQCVACQCFG